MRAKLVLLCTLATLVATGVAFTIAPAAAAAPADVVPASPALTIPITGTGLNTSFVGQFALQGFRVVNGQLSAVGQLTGTLTNTVTGATQTVNQLVTIPITAVRGTCQILHLELGPLDLNVLGLMIHLDKVVLDITAQSGPGNLLGNLLCAVAHLLDSNAAGQGLASILNNLLRALG
jgi:hypothetical protein